jgi:hypothetical protein
VPPQQRHRLGWKIVEGSLNPSAVLPRSSGIHAPSHHRHLRSRRLNRCRWSRGGAPCRARCAQHFGNTTPACVGTSSDARVEAEVVNRPIRSERLPSGPPQRFAARRRSSQDQRSPRRGNVRPALSGQARASRFSGTPANRPHPPESRNAHQWRGVSRVAGCRDCTSMALSMKFPSPSTN